jgi:hypothetical protein
MECELAIHRWSIWPGIFSLCAVLTLTACHDAPRKNPFDPELTPAVALTAALDDTAGTVMLNWTEYVGEQKFAEYRVLRNIARFTEVDTLAVIEELTQTMFVDSSLAPDTAYEYRVDAVNAAGFAVSSEIRNVTGYSVEAVHLLRPVDDPQIGTVTLTWTQYRNPGFEGYQVLRRAVGTDQVEELADIASLGDTVFVDSTLRADIDYVYSVDVGAAGKTLTSNAREGRLVLPVVELSEPVFDSATASATLTWTPYRGPRFQAFQVRRRTIRQMFEIVEEIEDSSVTSIIDGGLLGNTEYVYQVVVLTERGEEVRSEEVTGALHQWLRTWPVHQWAFDDWMREHIRLEKRSGGGVIVLISTPLPAVRELDGDGNWVDEYPVLGPIGLESMVSMNFPRSVAIAADLGIAPDGRRIVSINMPASLMNGASENYGGALQYDSQGQPIWQIHEVFQGKLSDNDGGDEAVVSGEIVLGSYGHYSTVIARSEGEVLFTEDFSDFPRKEPWGGALPAVVGPWEFSGDADFWPRPVSGRHAIMLYSRTQARRTDETWQDFSLEADGSFGGLFNWAMSSSHTWQIRMGGNTFSQYALTLHPPDQTASLQWIFTPPEGSELAAKDATVTIPYTTIPHVHHRLNLEVVEGNVDATISTPVMWSEVYEDMPNWSSIAAFDDYVALTLYDRVHTLDANGVSVASSQFDKGVSETRVWEDDQGRQRIGVCLPEAGEIRWGPILTAAPAEWFKSMKRKIGPGIGPPGEFLNYPMSFAVGPDGRFFVLDAGNGRIVVLNTSGKYITHWGIWGEGDGEFNFGEYWASTHQPGFSGSIAVDKDGFVYVADERSKRIQKFAP